jgi:Putative transposase
LSQTFAAGKLRFYGQLQALAQPKVFRSFLRQLFRHRWVVYCKPPFGGPDQALRYLGAYTHRVAISNHRLVSLVDDQVTFRWRDSAHQNKKRLMTLSVDEFLRRFLLHVLPRGFVRIRHYGFLSSRHRRELVPLCKKLLSDALPAPTPTGAPASTEPVPMWICPLCGGPMVVIDRLAASQITLRSPPQRKIA